MILELLKQENSSLAKRVEAFSSAMGTSRIIIPPETAKFIFVCGANKNPGEISARREALVSFIHRSIPNTKCIIAESVFETFQRESHTGNILDIESDISIFSDFILIVLESSSAFTELGAFSSIELRKKLIVINNSEYDDSPSFINLGPIKAISENVKEKRVLSYRMNNDGVHTLDSIGSIYNDLYGLLSLTKSKTRRFITKSKIDPSDEMSKDILRFVHDLVYFAGPIGRKEIIQMLVMIFGPKDFKKLTHYLALLTAFGSISILGNNYFSMLDESYLIYPFNTESFRASFKKSYYKYAPERIHGCN